MTTMTIAYNDMFNISHESVVNIVVVDNADHADGLIIDFADKHTVSRGARRENALILVAEDNETNQIVIRQMLSKMGFACELAENGQVALDMLARPGYGLLLTDFNMPVMDGFELSRAVRTQEMGTGRHLPILALTADALALGADEGRDKLR